MAMEKRIKAVIQIRRAKKAEWEELNPILRSGEPGVELDTKMVKVGDGETPWNQLPYIGGAGAIDYEILSASYLKSPNGSKWALQVDNDGNLSATLVN